MQGTTTTARNAHDLARLIVDSHKAGAIPVVITDAPEFVIPVVRYAEPAAKYNEKVTRGAVMGQLEAALKARSEAPQVVIIKASKISAGMFPQPFAKIITNYLTLTAGSVAAFLASEIE